MQNNYFYLKRKFNWMWRWS